MTRLLSSVGLWLLIVCFWLSSAWPWPWPIPLPMRRSSGRAPSGTRARKCARRRLVPRGRPRDRRGSPSVRGDERAPDNLHRAAPRRGCTCLTTTARSRRSNDERAPASPRDDRRAAVPRCSRRGHRGLPGGMVRRRAHTHGHIRAWRLSCLSSDLPCWGSRSPSG